MVSYRHYKKLVNKKFNLSSLNFIKSENEHWPCPWDEHVSGWLLQNNHTNLLLIRYEDMHYDTEKVLRNVIGFCGFTKEAHKIVDSIKKPNFEEMRKSEEKDGVRNINYNNNKRFIR
jgi:hypothetical protein